MSNTKANILLVEDDIDLGNVLEQFLKMNHYCVKLCRDGAEGLAAFSNNAFDICIFDVMMPKMDGYSLAEKISRSNQEIPFLFLTAKVLKEDKIKGLKMGADDYITKPFDPEELVLRLQNILKRSGKNRAQNLKTGIYTLDRENLRLCNGNTYQSMTEKESELLKMLIEHKNQVVKRNDILLSLWGDNDYFIGRSLDVFISRLRKYISGDSSLKLKTIRGVGYILEEN